MKEVTIRDLAQEAGVSTATISRVLNNQPGVSLMLRNRVVRLIKEMNYPVDSSSVPNTIGIVCGSLDINIGRYLAILLNQLYREIHRRGYQAMIVSYEDIALFNENLIKGVISIDFFQRISHKWPNLKNLPLVCINDNSFPLESIFSVRSDSQDAMCRMIRHLSDLKHRRIGFLQYFDQHEESKNINYDKQFFLSSANQAGIAATAFVETFNQDELIHEAIGKLLLHDITALIVKGESFTPRVRYSLELYRRRIPQDLSVITNDDEYSCRFFIPGQTTMAYDFSSLSKQAVDLLENLIAGKPGADVSVPYRFIERGSSGPAPDVFCK